MGRNYCKSKRKNTYRFEDKALFCLYGDRWEGCLYDSGFNTGDMEVVWDFYDQHKDLIYERWKIPCERPWCWLQFEMPEPKKIIEHVIIPSIEFDYKGEHITTSGSAFDRKESDIEYLKRLNLLEPWEVEALNNKNNVNIDEKRKER